MKNQAFRLELDPTAAQRALMIKGCGVRRKVWNHFLAQRIALYADGKQRTTRFKQDAEVTQLKKEEWVWMFETSKCIHQSALRDLDQAFQNFFRGLKTGEEVGFPQFKHKFEHDSYREFGAGVRFFPNERRAQLPKLGKVRVKDGLDQTTRFVGRILNATVSRVADRWFVSFCVERERAVPTPVVGPTVGVDLGLTTFATLSDGEKISAPKPLKAKLELLARRQRQHAKKIKGSNNRRKSALKLARLHWRISNVRKDFLNKLTTRLAKTKSVVVVEDLNVEGMKRRWGRSVSDVGFSEFRRQLAYKTQWYGSRLVVADRFFASSKLCSGCGLKNDSLTLSEREWTCGGCGAVHDRDENAAKNLAHYPEREKDLAGLATSATAGSAGSHACGEVNAGPAGASAPAGRRPRRNRKSKRQNIGL